MGLGGDGNGNENGNGTIIGKCSSRSGAGSQTSTIKCHRATHSRAMTSTWPCIIIIMMMMPGECLFLGAGRSRFWVQSTKWPGGSGGTGSTVGSASSFC